MTPIQWFLAGAASGLIIGALVAWLLERESCRLINLAYHQGRKDGQAKQFTESVR